MDNEDIEVPATRIATQSKITVCVRLRPIISEDMNQAHVLRKTPEICVHLKRDGQSIKLLQDRFVSKMFKVDHTFDHTVTQTEVYGGAIRPIIQDVLRGFNGTGIVYGQTASGKTYTQFGSENKLGMAHFAMTDIFDRVREYEDNGLVAKVYMSFYQIYVEQIYDLLSDEVGSSKNALPTPLNIREDAAKGTYVEGLNTFHVRDKATAYSLIAEGLSRRKMQSTTQNIKSSRSHAILQVFIDMEEEAPATTYKHEDDISTDDEEEAYNSSGKKYFIRRRKLMLVDLAGSERVAIHRNTTKVQVKEAAIINKSIAALGNVIYALSNRDGILDERHIPYRDCKLTRLLADSLGGNSKTCIIANISPCAYCYEETYSTLKFAVRAKMVSMIVKTTPATQIEEPMSGLKGFPHQRIDSRERIYGNMEGEREDDEDQGEYGEEYYPDDQYQQYESDAVEQDHYHGHDPYRSYSENHIPPGYQPYPMYSNSNGNSNHHSGANSVRSNYSNHSSNSSVSATVSLSDTLTSTSFPNSNQAKPTFSYRTLLQINQIPNPMSPPPTQPSIPVMPVMSSPSPQTIAPGQGIASLGMSQSEGMTPQGQGQSFSLRDFLDACTGKTPKSKQDGPQGYLNQHHSSHQAGDGDGLLDESTILDDLSYHPSYSNHDPVGEGGGVGDADFATLASLAYGTEDPTTVPSNSSNKRLNSDGHYVSSEEEEGDQEYALSPSPNKMKGKTNQIQKDIDLEGNIMNSPGLGRFSDRSGKKLGAPLPTTNSIGTSPSLGKSPLPHTLTRSRSEDLSPHVHQLIQQSHFRSIGVGKEVALLVDQSTQVTRLGPGEIGGEFKKPFNGSLNDFETFGATKADESTEMDIDLILSTHDGIDMEKVSEDEIKLLKAAYRNPMSLIQHIFELRQMILERDEEIESLKNFILDSV